VALLSQMLVKALVMALVAVPTAVVGPAGGEPTRPGPTVRPATSVSAASVSALRDVGPRCNDPAKVLNLDDWKITLPFGRPQSGTTPLEIVQPALATYTASPWFAVTPTCDAVLFRAPVNGVTTKGSKNPRSELREMSGHGTANASWSSTAGTHSLVVVEAFTHLPQAKPQLVGAQIHNADDDITVFRLEGRNLYVTDGNNAHHKLVTSDYTLGTKFEAKFVVGDGKVTAYYNGVPQTTITQRFSGAYFKAGAYTQANCGNSAPCSSDNYGETTIYSVTVEHHVTWWDEFWDLCRRVLPASVVVVVLIGLVGLIWRRSRVR